MSDITRRLPAAEAQGLDKSIKRNGANWFSPDETSPTGGARRDRTDDLLLAKQALSQLSYGPFRDQASGIRPRFT